MVAVKLGKIGATRKLWFHLEPVFAPEISAAWLDLLSAVCFFGLLPLWLLPIEALVVCLSYY